MFTGINQDTYEKYKWLFIVLAIVIGVIILLIFIIHFTQNFLGSNKQTSTNGSKT